MIFIIKKAWIDSMENDYSNAFGYKNYRYTENEDDAKDFCSKGKILTREDCWALTLGNEPEFIYEKVNHL